MSCVFDHELDVELRREPDNSPDVRGCLDNGGI